MKLVKRRKLRPQVIVVIVILFLFAGLFIAKKLINRVDYSRMQRLDISLHSRSYLLYCVDDNEVLYGDNNNVVIYPASLTKLMTMDAIVSSDVDLEECSSLSDEQHEQLVADNASLAYLSTDYQYSIKDLLFALILPSGADAALALENYQNDLLNMMNKRAAKLGMKNSSFTNCSGLHDENLYTTLDDLLLLCRDLLKYDVARDVLSSGTYMMSDGQMLTSSLKSICGEDDDLNVYGGKTGFTAEAGENIVVYYRYQDKDYLLLLAGADGDPYEGRYYHFDDVVNIFNELY